MAVDFKVAYTEEAAATAGAQTLTDAGAAASGSSTLSSTFAESLATNLQTANEQAPPAVVPVIAADAVTPSAVAPTIATMAPRAVDQTTTTSTVAPVGGQAPSGGSAGGSGDSGGGDSQTGFLLLLGVVVFGCFACVIVAAVFAVSQKSSSNKGSVSSPNPTVSTGADTSVPRLAEDSENPGRGGEAESRDTPAGPNQVGGTGVGLQEVEVGVQVRDVPTVDVGVHVPSASKSPGPARLHNKPLHASDGSGPHRDIPKAAPTRKPRVSSHHTAFFNEKSYTIDVDDKIYDPDN